MRTQPAGELGRSAPRLATRQGTGHQRRAQRGIEILDIDDPILNWTKHQRWVIQAVQRGEPCIDRQALRQALAQLEWPVTYIEFEVDPGIAVPQFEGCCPYDRIAFQWALVVQHAPGRTPGEQQDFLHLEDTDPSRPFALSLLETVPISGSLVAHYANTETITLKRLAERLGGALGDALVALIPRFVDSEDIARAGYYHPAQQGSWSIKKLAPALLGRGYEDLEIRDGMAAVLAWRQALRAKGEEREQLGRDLRAYCGRDATLMHAILEELRALAGEA